jgi:hypothetical protein
VAKKSFGEVVNRALRAAKGETAGGYEMPENNRRINAWMRSEKDRGTLRKRIWDAVLEEPDEE